MGRRKSILSNSSVKGSRYKSVSDINRYCSQTVSETYRKESGLKKCEHEFIINECSKLIIEEIINRNDGFKLPERLGTLVVIGSPPRVPVKNDKLYTKDKPIYHRNSNTGGLIFKVTLLSRRRIDGKHSNSQILTFRTTVPLRKAMKKCIDNNKTSQWTVVDNYVQRYYKNTDIVYDP